MRANAAYRREHVESYQQSCEGLTRMTPKASIPVPFPSIVLSRAHSLFNIPPHPLLWHTTRPTDELLVALHHVTPTGRVSVSTWDPSTSGSLRYTQLYCSRGALMIPLARIRCMMSHPGDHSHAFEKPFNGARFLSRMSLNLALWCIVAFSPDLHSRTGRLSPLRKTPATPRGRSVPWVPSWTYPRRTWLERGRRASRSSPQVVRRGESTYIGAELHSSGEQGSIRFELR